MILITGTLPGVIIGSVIRVELVPDPGVFDLMVPPSCCRWTPGWPPAPPATATRPGPPAAASRLPC